MRKFKGFDSPICFCLQSSNTLFLFPHAEPAEMSGPEVAKTPGGGAPGKEGKEPVANGHAGESSDANPFAEYMWMENEEEYNRQVCTRRCCFMDLFIQSHLLLQKQTDTLLVLQLWIP